MEKNPLRVAFTENKIVNSRPLSSKRSLREEKQAVMERLWLQSPQQFDSLRDCMERQRVQNTVETIKSKISLSGKHVVDLGCGNGTIARILRDAGAHVDAVDVASIALKNLKEKDSHNINPIHDCLPSTELQDKKYDLVVCTEVIGYHKPEEYRLLMAELGRLLKSDGLVVCSTSLDINTEDPLERFAELAETEFTIDKWVLSYHLLLIRLCNFFETPFSFVEASLNKEIRKNEIAKRKGLIRWWFKWNTGPVLATLWTLIRFISNPIAEFLRQNTTLMHFLDRFCRFFWSDAGISHALFIGKRRPLVFPVRPEDAPREIKHKRQVWE